MNFPRKTIAPSHLGSSRRWIPLVGESKAKTLSRTCELELVATVRLLVRLTVIQKCNMYQVNLVPGIRYYLGRHPETSKSRNALTRKGPQRHSLQRHILNADLLIQGVGIRGRDGLTACITWIGHVLQPSSLPRLSCTRYSTLRLQMYKMCGHSVQVGSHPGSKPLQGVH